MLKSIDDIIRILLRWYEWYSPLSVGKNRLLKLVNAVRPLKGRFRIRTKFGAIMDVNLEQQVQRRLYFQGIHEKNVLELMRDMSMDRREGSVFCDIGANVGQHSLFCALNLRFEKIYAFEPYPSTFAALRQNILLNSLEGKIAAVNLALSDKMAEYGMEVPSLSNDGMNYLLSGLKPDRSIVVRSTTLDSFAYENGITRIDMMKIDVEGAELNVVRGARGLLMDKRIGTLFVEVCDGHLARFNASSKELLEFMKDVGYSCFLIKKRRLLPIKTAAELPTFGDCVFTH